MVLVMWFLFYAGLQRLFGERRATHVSKRHCRETHQGRITEVLSEQRSSRVIHLDRIQPSTSSIPGVGIKRGEMSSDEGRDARGVAGNN